MASRIAQLQHVHHLRTGLRGLARALGGISRTTEGMSRDLHEVPSSRRHAQTVTAGTEPTLRIAKDATAVSHGFAELIMGSYSREQSQKVTDDRSTV